MARAFRDEEFLIAFPETPEKAWVLACDHLVAAIVLIGEFSLHSPVFSRCFPTLTWDDRSNPRELARQLTQLCRFCSDRSIH